MPFPVAIWCLSSSWPAWPTTSTHDLNLGSHPLVKDQAVADAWDLEFGHYTTVSRFLYDLSDEVGNWVQAELEAIQRPYLNQGVHEMLCHQEYLTLWCD